MKLDLKYKKTEFVLIAIIYISIVSIFVNMEVNFNYKLISMIGLVFLSYFLIIKYKLLGLIFTLFFYLTGMIAIFALYQFSEYHYNSVMAFQMAVVVSACYLHRYVRKEDKAKKELFEYSVIDEVTGAYNRRYYSIKLGEVFDESLRYDRRFSLVLLDIDKFKNINDSHGHSFGDAVLKEFSDEAKKVIRPSDTFCRMGGDEFLIILPNHEFKLQEDLSDRINNVTQVMNERFSSKLKGEFSVSVGLSVYPDDADNLEEIYRCADMAMYEAKMYNESKMIPYSDLKELHEISLSR